MDNDDKAYKDTFALLALEEGLITFWEEAVGRRHCQRARRVARACDAAAKAVGYSALPTETVRDLICALGMASEWDLAAAWCVFQLGNEEVSTQPSTRFDCGVVLLNRARRAEKGSPQRAQLLQESREEFARANAPMEAEAAAEPLCPLDRAKLALFNAEATLDLAEAIELRDGRSLPCERLREPADQGLLDAMAQLTAARRDGDRRAEWWIWEAVEYLLRLEAMPVPDESPPTDEEASHGKDEA